jgi:hypothetical protein
MRAGGLALHLITAALVLAVAAPAPAELRINDLDVFLNDYEVTVHVVLLGAVPPSFTEGLESGLPAHLRFTIELWQYNRFWPDRLLTTRVVERQLTYNVVTKEFKVASLKGETRSAYATREMRDAQRVLSELRGMKLTPATSLDPTGVIYVRVSAETALGGENTFLARFNGTAEQTSRQSNFRTLMRAQ